jgi:hypothetical protein
MAANRYVPEKFNVITSADDIGALLDLPRITGEDLYSYKKRILESSEKLANSSYEGLINAINRELGLERKKILEVQLKNKLEGSIDGVDISASLDTLTDNRSWSGTINGTSVIAVGSTFTTTVDVFIPNNLTGLTIEIDNIPYDVLSNTSNSITFNGEVSAVTGLSYLIHTNWATNKFVGLALVVGKRKYEILENDTNTIRVDMDINLGFGFDYSVTALRPRVQITSSRIILYKEYLNEENFQLDMEIPLRDGNYLHGKIVEDINASSFFFKCENLVPLEEEVAIFTIKQQDSDVTVHAENVPGTKFFKLKNKNLKNGTVQFSETDVFLREVADIEAVMSGSYYFIDYKQGIIRSKNIPNGRGTVSYVYSVFPFKAEATPASITPFVDEEADSFMFAQKEKIIYTDQRDKFISSQPKSEMIEYISELLKVTDQTWGE